MQRATKGKICRITALVVDVAAPLAATLSQFPVWVDKSAGATVSGLFVLFAFLSAIPFFRQLREYFKSPAAWVMWGIIFVALLALRTIIDEAAFICLVGFVANLVGAGIHKLGDYFDPPNAKGGGSGEGGA